MRPSTVQPCASIVGAHAVARALERRFARDPAFDEIAAVELELWLDEADEPRPRARELKHMRQHKPLRNEAHIDDDRAGVSPSI